MATTDLRETEPVVALDPPQFTLRTLWIIVTVCGLLFALMATLGVMASVAIGLFASLVFAHVLGNSLGTKLCERASQRAMAQRMADPRPASDPQLFVSRPPGRLTQRARLHRIAPLTTIAGALVGGTLGGGGLAGTYPDAPWSAVALGVVSSAVLGGFAGFTTSSFLSVARQALREALSDCGPTPAPRAQSPQL